MTKVKEEKMIVLGARKPDKRLYARYNGPEGWDHDKAEFEQLETEGQLKKGELYLLKSVYVMSSSTKIELQGVDGELNSIAFDIFEMKNGQLAEYDILEDAKLNPFVPQDPEDSI